MTSLSRRLQRLEAGCRQNAPVAADRRRFIQQQALQHLTTDQLRFLIELKKAPPRGRQLTSEELAMLNALNTAVDLECQKAGVSQAGFKRYHGASNQAARS
jgi:hypothetical protein